MMKVEKRHRLAADRLFTDAREFPLTAKLHALVSEHFARFEATELAAANARAAELERELARRKRNEARNCINWGPCSDNDGRMADAGDA